MEKPLFKSMMGLFLLAGLIAACSFGPPKNCGDDIGGTADTTKFDQYFSRMALVNAASGESGPEGDSGMQYASSDLLAIRADNLADVDVRLCVQNFSTGSIASDNTRSFKTGSDSFELGSFEKGTYVMRVIVDGSLVKNFPFEIK